MQNCDLGSYQNSLQNRNNTTTTSYENGWRVPGATEATGGHAWFRHHMDEKLIDWINEVDDPIVN